MRRPIVLAVVLALVVGCGSASPSRPVPSQPTPPDDGIELASVERPRLATTTDDRLAVGEAVNDFGLELYRRVVDADPAANAVISPASIALALAMARAGARGDTAAEMDAVMRDLGAEGNAAWVAALDASLNAKSVTVEDDMGDRQDVVLRSVNAPFAQRGYPIEEAYLVALAERFAAGLRIVDYLADPEGSRAAINGWVSDQTEDRIPELLEQGTVTPDTRLVLVNAIYLKAPWRFPFEEGATIDQRFTGLGGTVTQVPMMRTGYFTGWAEGDGWTAAELPYAGDGLGMLVIVPDDLAAFERTLDGARLAEIAGALESTEVSIELPRFSAETQVGLAEALGAMGMPTAFDPGSADFSGMMTAERLYIGAVVHQANIDVDETGTEAAAATAVAMAAGAAPGEPKRLVADRPFLFALRDHDTGAVMFLGRVTQPESTAR